MASATEKAASLAAMRKAAAKGAPPAVELLRELARELSDATRSIRERAERWEYCTQWHRRFPQDYRHRLDAFGRELHQHLTGFGHLDAGGIRYSLDGHGAIVRTLPR